MKLCRYEIWCLTSYKIQHCRIQNFRFADDQAMVSHTQCGLQRIMDALQHTSEKYNMRINVKKTKVMRMPGRKGRKLRIVVNGKELESVTQFCYLGSMVTEDCRCECEVRRHIGHWWQTWLMMSITSVILPAETHHC